MKTIETEDKVKCPHCELDTVQKFESYCVLLDPKTTPHYFCTNCRLCFSGQCK